jgi:hypothetical protein
LIWGYCRDKYEQFKAKWAEQSAWSNISLRENAVHKQRDQELTLIRKAHIIVCAFTFLTMRYELYFIYSFDRLVEQLWQHYYKMNNAYMKKNFGEMVWPFIKT